MQTLANIVFGAMLAGFSLGPAAWEDIARFESRLSHAAMALVGAQTPSALDSAVDKARGALPHAH